LIDGSEEIYKVVPPVNEDLLSVKTQIRKFKDEPLFLLTTEDQMIVILRSALKKFVISLPFTSVPEPALRVVRRIE